MSVHLSQRQLFLAAETIEGLAPALDDVTLHLRAAFQAESALDNGAACSVIARLLASTHAVQDEMCRLRDHLIAGRMLVDATLPDLAR